MHAQPVITPMPTYPQTIIELIGDADQRLARSFAETLERIGLTNDRVIVRLDRVGLVHADGIADIAETILRERRAGRDVVVATSVRRLERLLDAHKIPVTPPFRPDAGLAQRHVMLVQRGRASEASR
ncbi:MAG: hypothetical protein ABI346_10065 [Candidatus Baltobacteraceae bacterium]